MAWKETRSVGLPLSRRRRDLPFVAAFSAFVVTSIVTDSVNGLNGRLDPASSYPIERFVYDSYARLADPLLILNPPQVRVSAWISAFVWLPLYVVFVAGFIKGWNWIRPLGLVYGGALSHGMITYMAEGLFGTMAMSGWADPAICPGCVEPSPLYYLAANLPYLLVPAAMIVRMWRPLPFGVADGHAEPVEIDLRGPEAVVRVGDRVVVATRVVHP